MPDHKDLKIIVKGKPVEEAAGVMIMVHGRGATAESILSLSEEFNNEDWAYLAPQAIENTWYPFSFLAPIDQNEPGITTGIQNIKDLVKDLVKRKVDKKKIIILGFSQGGCLVLEFAARNAARYGGIIGLSSGLIGPENTSRTYRGSMEGTPVFLGCSNDDPHVPIWRIKETNEVFKTMEAQVTLKVYPGMPHAIIEDEIEIVKSLMKDVAKAK